MPKQDDSEMAKRRDRYMTNLATMLGPFLARGVRVEGVDPVDGSFNLRCRSTGRVASFSPTGDDMAYMQVSVDGEQAQ